MMKLDIEARRAKHDLSLRGIGTALVAGLLLLVAVLGAATTSVPVTIVKDFELVSITDRSISYRVVMWKPKGCEFVPGSAVGWYKMDGDYWEESGFEFVADMSPDSNHPTTWIDAESFGTWRWHVPDTIRLEAVRTTVLHNCGGEIRTTTIGPKVI